MQPIENNKLTIKTLTGFIEIYQAIKRSGLFVPSCRFAPTCSQYAKEAILSYGAIKGIWLAVRRLVKCNPFYIGGWDPVPASPKEGRS